MVTGMVKYKIEIDREGCIGCGACYALDPSHYESDEEGKSKVVGSETDASNSSGVFEDEGIELVREAESSCPVFAIVVTEL